VSAGEANLMDADGRTAEVARELVRRRADLVDHARGSLEQHLVAVHQVLERWGQPERVRLAGLLHSGYSTESFGFRLFGARERPRVRELIGVDAERLVFAFGGVTRDDLLASAADAADATRLTTRWEAATVTLRRRDVAELLVIHAANLAEQTCRARGGPSPWLAEASRILALARRAAEVVPPVFEGGTSVVTPGDEAALLHAYAALLPRMAPSVDVREQHGRDVLPASPVGEPLIVAGLVALAEGRAGKAAALGRRALAAFDTWGVAWDKRLGMDRWRSLGELLVRDGETVDRELDRAARRARTVLDRSRGSPERIWAQLDALHALPPSSPERPLATPRAPRETVAIAAGTSGPSPLPPRFARYLEGLRTNTERAVLPFYPGLRTLPWHDPREHPIVADLERFAPAIAEEARALEMLRFQDEAEDIGRTGRWSVLFLHELGRRNEENLARCPTTAKIIEKHRTVTTSTGLVYFSCLDPQTRVAPHQGPTNLRVRCHLGLEVPESCGMRVGGVTGTWREGRCVVFDDSFWHEVWNDSDQRRIVLIIDLWHPDLSDDEVALLSGLQRYGMTNASATGRGLARNDVARERARGAAVDRVGPGAHARASSTRRRG
jgi:hypothetical protein